MDYKTLLERVGLESNSSREEVANFIDAFVEILEESLKSQDIVSVPGFGNFESKKRNERIMTHPSDSKKRLLVPPKVVVSFKPSLLLKTRINEQ